ncbi:MAG: dimethylsulfonioproprionate lyase family protein [Gammaproteobacteria bacterium]|nr:dimethylsulfonioproprionate lyase family protein [Gammaproteobacteria bacterium]MCY4218657.1 dimethylsulfonioproprionate lyase family protein [Gammaproteobacteria bacterium]MCY4274795.1 dimethylsulfonioproprionate lyase family protein [Gammaproteobacteria bacterium]
MQETNRASEFREIHAEILSTMERMVFESENLHVQKFKDGFQDVGDRWCDVGCRVLPVISSIVETKPDSGSQVERLLSLVINYRECLFWEQTYTKADGVVGDALLSGYAFAEISGQQGPFISNQLRTGVGVWAPHVEYPLHWHDAEEIYWILSGSVRFQVGRDRPKLLKNTGEIIYISSSVPHSFETSDESVVMFYLWQGGDLRQVSTFEKKIS